MTGSAPLSPPHPASGQSLPAHQSLQDSNALVGNREVTHHINEGHKLCLAHACYLQSAAHSCPLIGYMQQPQGLSKLCAAMCNFQVHAKAGRCNCMAGIRNA